MLLQFNDTGEFIVCRSRARDVTSPRHRAGDVLTVYDLRAVSEGQRLRGDDNYEDDDDDAGPGVEGYPDLNPDNCLLAVRMCACVSVWFCMMLCGCGSFQIQDSNAESDYIKVPAWSPCGAYFASPFNTGVRLFSFDKLLRAYRDSGSTITRPEGAMIANITQGKDRGAGAAAAKAASATVSDAAILEGSGVQLVNAFSPTAPYLATGYYQGYCNVLRPV